MQVNSIDSNYSTNVKFAARKQRVKFLLTNIVTSSPEVKYSQKDKFEEVLAKFNTLDIFSPDKYLKLLLSLKANCNDYKDFYKHPIDVYGNNLTTSFFDVAQPANDVERSYYNEIIKILSQEKNLDFNQKCGDGISIMEKVLFSENHKLLDFVKNKQPIIKYSKELDYIYTHIQDKTFKEKVENMMFEFEPLTKALKLKGENSIDLIMPHIANSPLLRNTIQNHVKYVLDEIKDKQLERRLISYYPHLLKGSSASIIWKEMN